MSNFADRLIGAIRAKRSYLVGGIDPFVELMPSHVLAGVQEGDTKGTADAIVEFYSSVLEAIADYVVAVKPQIAFFERLGLEGMRAFSELLRRAAEYDLIVVGDVKRSDIGSTAEAYAEAYLGAKSEESRSHRSDFEVDAVTLNPYLGVDSVEPFLERTRSGDKGVFVLVHTSNPSAGEIQELPVAIGDAPLVPAYEVVARLVADWGQRSCGESGYTSVGAVVGLTYPEAAHEVREILGRSFILVPGYGAQGGSAEDLASFFRDDGLGALVNSSRGISYAYRSDRWSPAFGPARYAEAARAEAERARQEINEAVSSASDLAWK